MVAKIQALAPTGARYLLGLMFFIFGAAGLFNLFPPPPNMPEKLQTFMNGIMVTGYFMPFLKATETTCGLLLLAGIAPALALIVLAPISIHIFLVHATLTPGLENLILPLVILILHVTSATAYWNLYRPLFSRQVKSLTK